MYSLLLFTESKTQNSWDNFWLWCKVDGIQTHAQLELIPGPNTTVYTACRNCGDIGPGISKRRAIK